MKDRGSSITGYVVEYRPTSNPASPFETQVVERDVSSTALESLVPSTKYEVRVRGENAVGWGVPSVTMWTKTKAESCLKEVNFNLRLFLNFLQVDYGYNSSKFVICITVEPR